MNDRNTMRGVRGASAVLLAISVVALMGMASLAIDLAMLQKARAEAQRTADATALAGASAFLLDLTPGEESNLAVQRAKELAAANVMMGTPIDPESELTVTVVADSQKVRTKVRRANVSIWFGRIFGHAGFAVGATAAAVADYASGTKCIKPLALPDLWQDAGDLNNNHLPDAGEAWQYGGEAQGDTYARAEDDGAGTGLGSTWRNVADLDRDWGLRVILRPPASTSDPSVPCPSNLQGGKCYMPGWWGLWGPNMQDQASLTDRFLACTPLAGSAKFDLDTVTYTTGTDYPSKTGVTELSKAMQDLYALDANAQWDPNAIDPVTQKMGAITGSTFGLDNWRASPRVWTVAVFDPGLTPTSPTQPIQFNNFFLFFHEGCMRETGPNTGQLSGDCHPGSNRYPVGRFVGRATGTAVGPSPGSMVRILRLVE